MRASIASPTGAGTTVLAAGDRCPLCAATSYLPRARVDGALVVACGVCGLVRQEDAHVDPRLYGETYYRSDLPKGGYANYVRDAAINRRTFGARLSRIESRAGTGRRLLDVGCALGDFVLEAARRGWSAEGIEISEFAAAEARRRGASVHLGSLGDGAVAAASYDVVTLYDTLEHTSDPLGMLRGARRALRPGGLAHIVTPNVDGLQARLLGRHWYHYKPGEHLVYFGPRTLRRAVEAAGLRWLGSARTGSFVSVSYVLDRLRAYSPAFRLLGRASAAIGLDAVTFYLYAGEIEAWAARRD